MVKVIMGLKGSGKTKKLVDLVLQAEKEEKGAVVCIEKDKKLTYDIPHSVRLIQAGEYGINNVDMAVLIGSAILFWLVGWFFKKRTITRVEGALLVICYVAYTAYLISQQ